MNKKEWESMDEMDFECLLENSVSELPPEDVVANVTPWKKAMNRVLIGMALSAITLNFLCLDYILPAIGMVLSILGFRTLRRENQWFGACFVITLLRAAYLLPSLILNTTIYHGGVYASAIGSVLSVSNIGLLFALFFCLRSGLRAVQQKVDLLDDLDKVIQGNKLVEYVATSQLKYIAIEASKRLKDITKGRYALEIDSTLNFVMRDDFNGGIRRSVDTLSGGETFLTSLSLALALSSQIQLKGSAPLEFFFLDEGFGSLDTELLDTVMGSLERLHNDKLSVGIITHVEELKNRVPVKLIVKPSEAGIGSKVKIEYS